MKIWHHVDAAYGGFYACVKNSSNSYLTKQTLALRKIDSLTLDPHKLGYVPYACGTFICRDSKKYFYNDSEAPYIQFKSAKEVGLQSIEGSRPATGAAATWLTAQSLGFNSKGLGRILTMHLDAKKSFQRLLQKKVKGLLFTKGLDLNTLCWTVVPESRRCESRQSDVFDAKDSIHFIQTTFVDFEKGFDKAPVGLKKRLVRNTFKQVVLAHDKLAMWFYLDSDDRLFTFKSWKHQVKENRQ